VSTELELFPSVSLVMSWQTKDSSGNWKNTGGTGSGGGRVKRTQIKPSDDELLNLLEHESNWQLMNASPLTTMTGE
jgi:hypothetical protein